jgi:hypothetical protein
MEVNEPMRYRRAVTAGGSYFFTVNLADRQSDLLIWDVDYIRFNPVRHGWVARAVDWPCSTPHRYIERVKRWASQAQPNLR